MTKEQAIEEIYKAFEPAYANYIITALAEGATISDKALKPCDDCVSRQAVLDILSHYAHNFGADNEIKALPPVTPTQCIATVQFSKEDLRDICKERIEIECTHGTCKDCKYCEDIGVKGTFLL